MERVARGLLAVCFIGMAFLIQHRLNTLQDEVGQLRSDMKILDAQHNLTKAELFLRTDPAYVDESIRDYYERLIKESPDQVRGIDGKYPRER